MPPSPRTSALRTLAAATLLVVAGGPSLPLGGPRAASAEGAQLDGLMAPELSFPDGLNGITRGTSLSSLRGRVVWIKFWLRDCPRCQRTLPEAQRLHELYGHAGLVVLTVVHQYGPDQVRPLLTQKGYTFPVGCDPTGALARAYQVNHRPTDYLVASDGRVRFSNGAPTEVLLAELGEARARELGRLPQSLDPVVALVRQWRYGAALREAEARASAPEATPELKAFAQRFGPLALERLAGRVQTANAHWRLKETEAARLLFAEIVGDAGGTPFEAKAREAQAAFEQAVGG